MDFLNTGYFKIAFLGEDIGEGDYVFFIEEKLKYYINKFIAEKENIIFFVTDGSGFERLAKNTLVTENAKYNKGCRFVYTVNSFKIDTFEDLNSYIKTVNRADLIICFNKGKMTQIINYAKEQGKEIINLFSKT